MRKEYDLTKLKSRKNPYAKHLKQQVTIRLGVDVISYFKELAEETGLTGRIARIAGGQRPLRVPFSRLGSGVARLTSGTRRRGAGRPRSTLQAVRLRGIGPPGSREHDPPTSTAELSWVVTAPPPTSLGTHESARRSLRGTSTEKWTPRASDHREAPRERWAIPSLSTRTRSTATW